MKQHLGSTSRFFRLSLLATFLLMLLMVGVGYCQDEPTAPIEQPQAQQAEATPAVDPNLPQGLEKEASDDLYYAMEQLMQGKIAEARQAVAWLEEREDLQPETVAYLHSVLGTAAAYEGKYQEAVQEFQTMLTWAVSEQAKVAAYSAIGCNLRAQGRLAEAIAQYEALITNHPKVPEYCAEANYQIGDILYLQGRYQEALSRFSCVQTKYATTSWKQVIGRKVAEVSACVAKPGAK